MSSDTKDSKELNVIDENDAIIVKLAIKLTSLFSIIIEGTTDNTSQTSLLKHQVKL